MKKIGVIGAGTMGQGIANAFASAGNDVTVVDVKKNGLKTESIKLKLLKISSLLKAKFLLKMQKLLKPTSKLVNMKILQMRI